jgi:methanogenic corrinoid protein MtbC1
LLDQEGVNAAVAAPGLEWLGVRRTWDVRPVEPVVRAANGATSMSQELLVERFFESLINGDRASARAIVQEAVSQNVSATKIISDLFWPTHELIDRMFRNDQLTQMGFHMSTRLLRVLVDQQAARLPVSKGTRGSIFVCCGPSQNEELGAQMATDMLEAHGYTVRFAGGGIPVDEILSTVQTSQPDILLLFASAASDLPDVRILIDSLREIGAVNNTRLVVGGGVFNRADGLAEEMGADAWAVSPLDVVDLLLTETIVARPAATASIEAKTMKKKVARKAA